MKKSQLQLLKLATKFQTKYAQTQTLKQIIENAASYGQQSANGIMNFIQMLKQDQASLAINVTISGNNATVSSPTVTPGDKAPNYSRLPEQIEKYLNRNLSTSGWSFPGTTLLEWDFQGGVAQK